MTCLIRGRCPARIRLAQLALVVAIAAPGAAPAQGFVDRGLRWVGTAPTCVAPAPWFAEPLFRTLPLPPSLAGYCLYTWVSPTPGTPPTALDVAALRTGSGAADLTEDVRVVVPTQSAPTGTALRQELRAALRDQIGGSTLLPAAPARPVARVVVIDSAPDAAHGHIQPGESRHGDTLAHLIEDLVCPPTGLLGPCAAEVSTVLALPWLSSGVAGPRGGYLGTLADLARAVERAVLVWKADRLVAPRTTPPRLILNLSVGWEDQPFAPCSTGPVRGVPGPRAVRAILQHAAGLGALIVAAAGNDAGGPSPPTGLTCPGRYQALPQDAAPTRALLVAASGVDYRDQPLLTTRPLGKTGIAAPGLGGVAWNPADAPPPPLTGSSVSTAAVSAVSALVWAHQPGWAANEVSQAVYAGGVDVGAADVCPMLLSSCRSHRATTCGALHAAGAVVECDPPAPQPGSCPAAPTALDELIAAYAGVAHLEPLPASVNPRELAPSAQVAPWVWPMPIAATCPICALDGVSVAAPATLVIPALGVPLGQATLVVLLASDGAWHKLALGALSPNTPYVFTLPSGWVVTSAYLTGTDDNGFSITEPLYVEP